MPEIKRSPLVAQVIDYLRQQIEGRAWAVGQRLPNENELAATLGVGRSTVREAVRALAHSGWLEVRQGAGTFVKAVAASDQPDMQAVKARLSRGKLLDIYEVRRALEIEAARLAALRRQNDDLIQIEGALNRREAARVDNNQAAFVQADLDFHAAIVEAAHNPVLNELYGVFIVALQEALQIWVADPELHADTSDEHKRLAAAVRDSDATAAASASQQHLDRTMQNLRRLLADQ